MLRRRIYKLKININFWSSAGNYFRAYTIECSYQRYLLLEKSGLIHSFSDDIVIISQTHGYFSNTLIRLSLIMLDIGLTIICLLNFDKSDYLPLTPYIHFLYSFGPITIKSLIREVNRV